MTKTDNGAGSQPPPPPLPPKGVKKGAAGNNRAEQCTRAETASKPQSPSTAAAAAAAAAAATTTPSFFKEELDFTSSRLESETNKMRFVEEIHRRQERERLHHQQQDRLARELTTTFKLTAGKRLTAKAREMSKSQGDGIDIDDVPAGSEQVVLSLSLSRVLFVNEVRKWSCFSESPQKERLSREHLRRGFCEGQRRSTGNARSFCGGLCNRCCRQDPTRLF